MRYCVGNIRLKEGGPFYRDRYDHLSLTIFNSEEKNMKLKSAQIIQTEFDMDDAPYDFKDVESWVVKKVPNNIVSKDEAWYEAGEGIKFTQSDFPNHKKPGRSELIRERHRAQRAEDDMRVREFIEKLGLK